jgi:hypothetical protein
MQSVTYAAPEAAETTGDMPPPASLPEAGLLAVSVVVDVSAAARDSSATRSTNGAAKARAARRGALAMAAQR